MLPQLGLEGRKMPCAALYNPKMGQVFPFDKRVVEPGRVEDFINRIVKGEVRALGTEPEGGEGRRVEDESDVEGEQDHAHDEL
jgi:hypothetical protein